MTDQLSFRKSANIERVTDKRKDSLFRLVDTDGSGTIDAQEFAVLYDAIKKDLAEELEKEAVLQNEASSARRRFKMLLLFVAVLVSFLAASVAANFAVIFTVIDNAITTTTTSSGVLEVKGSDTIAKTALATEAVPMIVAPVLDLDTLGSVKSLQVTYGVGGEVARTHVDVVAVRKHNTTFVEFITSIPGETVEALNGQASYVVYPTASNKLSVAKKYSICAANATCSAFKASGVDTDAAFELAKAELEKHGFQDAARRLQAYSSTITDPYFDSASCVTGNWQADECSMSACNHFAVSKIRIQYYDGYSGTRHVVFFFHGLFQYLGYMWDAFCSTTWPATCSELELPAFKHLVFVFASSAAFPIRWGNNPANAVSYKDWGGKFMQNMVCGRNLGFMTAGMCDGEHVNQGHGSSYLYDFTYGVGGVTYGMNVGNASQVMSIGFSDGAGMAAFSNWAYGTMVTKAVAIDYHAYNNYQNWLSHPHICGSGMACGLIHLKAYTSCESSMFTTDAITTTPSYVSEASLVSMGYTTVQYGPLPGQSHSPADFKEFLWEHASDGRYLKWAVHGLTSGSLTGGCDSQAQLCPAGSGCTGAQIHDQVIYYTGAVDDIVEWVTAPSPPPTQASADSPSPPPPTISPSPPPVVFLPCDNVKMCCPSGFTCMAPVGSYSIFAKKVKKQCIGLGGVTHPMPCEELPWAPVCEAVMRMDFRKAADIAREVRMKLEEVPCATDEICETAKYSIEKAVDMAYDMGMEPTFIPCLKYKLAFYQAMPGPTGYPGTCDCDYICSMLDYDEKMAHQKARECFNKRSAYMLPCC